MIKSLEFRWIGKKAKDLILPSVLFVPRISWCSAYFCLPENSERLINGRYYDLSKGLIVIGEHNDSNETANTIAHEWRHCWQFFNVKGAFKIIQKFNYKISYKKAIVKFFKNPNEFDALLFSHKFAPSPVSENWLDMIHHSQPVKEPYDYEVKVVES
jgi:hypothetical protein